MNKLIISRNLFYFFLLYIFSEFFGDSIMLTYDSFIYEYDSISKLFILVLFLIIFISSFNSLPKLNKYSFPFWIVITILLYGVLIGLIFNKPTNALNDGASYFPILLILILPKFNFNNIQSTIFKFINILIVILFIKFILNQFFSILIWGVPSWKVLFKQSPILLIGYSIYLGSFLKSASFKKLMFIFSILFLLIIAMARMIFIGIIFITFFQIILNFNKFIIPKILVLFSIFILSFSTYFFTQKSDNNTIFENLYNGKNYEDGVDYRMNQVNILLTRFMTYPITGVGFGAVTKGYETYEDLAKPYQLELDLINFFSKIGIFISILYLYSYYYLFNLIFLIKNKINQKFYFSFIIGLFSLLVYSLGQTAHQGYLYWVIYSIFYSLLIIELKNQTCHIENY